MTATTKHRTPADVLQAAARWVEENADELVAGDGVYVAEDGLDLDVTIHLQSASFTTVTVDGHTNYIVLERKVGRMTATEELRRMLDERGVKWCPSAWDRSTETYWKTADGNGCLAIQGETKLRLSFADYLTPEQAIEATLGRGTCEPVDGYDDDGEEIGTCCSECGSPWPVYYVVRYCPVCGCKVVDDASVD